MPVSDEEAAEEFLVGYPTLKRDGVHLWRGQLPIHASFENQERKDEFAIEIRTSPDHPTTVPFLREVGGRTSEIAAKHQLRDIRDLHYSLATQSACLCLKQEEAIRFPPGSTLTTFVRELAVPYLYGLSYFDAHGSWPWAEYSHGVLGTLEYASTNTCTEALLSEVAAQVGSEKFAADLRKQFRRLIDNARCPCGSGKPFRRCHIQARRGLIRLRHAALLGGLKLDALFPR